MAYEQKDMSGSIFNNTKKEKDTHPDRTGDCTIGGRKYWISGWVKQDRNGKQYLSLAFKPKEQRSAASEYEAERRQDARAAERVAAGTSTSRDMDDEIPF